MWWDVVKIVMQNEEYIIKGKIEGMGVLFEGVDDIIGELVDVERRKKFDDFEYFSELVRVEMDVCDLCECEFKQLCVFAGVCKL